MATLQTTSPPVPAELVEAIRAFPPVREVRHCGAVFTVSPFDIYAECPQCGGRIKVRSFSAQPELEDVFDAVIGWMLQDGVADVIRKRQQEIAEDNDLA